MPVVIKEMHVKVNIEEPAREQQDVPQPDSSQDQDALIDACVEKVLDVLNREKLR